MLGGGGGLGSTIMTGMAFGAGSAVAHEAVRGIIGGGSGHGTNQQQMAPQEQQQMAPAQYNGAVEPMGQVSQEQQI